MPASRPLVERFWEKILKQTEITSPHVDTPCWVWTAKSKSIFGYGVIKRGHGTGQVVTHRLSWEFHNGQIPEGKLVLHKCDNPPCVNPAHLFLGDDAVNMADKVAKGRQKNGKIYKGSEHYEARITEDQVREMRQLYSAGGLRQIDLAEMYGLSRPQIGLILTRKRWKHVA